MAYLNHQQHPLQNDVILNALLKYLTELDDIKNARLVCSTWKTASLKTWRERGVLVVLQEREEEGACLKYPTRSELLEELMKSQGWNGLELEQKPFQRIKLTGWTFDEYPQEFMERMGGSIKYLHLEACLFPTFAELDELLTAGGALPALLKLVWSNSRFENAVESRTGYDRARDYASIVDVKKEIASRADFQRSLKSLEVTYNSISVALLNNQVNLTSFLAICPNLEEIIVRQTPANNYVPNPASMQMNKSIFWEGISNLRFITDKKPVNLRSLDIMDFSENASLMIAYDLHCNLLANLPLERFAVDVGRSTSEFAREMFSALAGTLKVLHAFRAPLRHFTFYESAPLSVEMGALTELRLWGDFTTNLEFLRHTPHLHTLVLRRDCSDKRYKLKGFGPNSLRFNAYESVVQNTVRLLKDIGIGEPRGALMVQGLKHLDTDYNIRPQSIPTLASWLPNVTTLKMVLKNEVLEAVSSAWSQLTELECLYGSRVDDGGVSCLLQITVLNKFKSNAYCGQGLFTSSSADRVFLKMPALNSLDICVSSEMSVGSEEELRQKISHVKVNRNYDDGDDDEMRHSHECCDRIRFLD